MAQKKSKTSASSHLESSFEQFYNRVHKILSTARGRVLRAINDEMVMAAWQTGQEIVEEEQRGQKRAEYGAQIIQMLSKRLTKDFGKGYTLTNLKYMRQFYLAFPIGHAVSDQLTWTHYRMILSVKNEQARQFYIAESARANWSTRELPPYFTLFCFD